MTASSMLPDGAARYAALNVQESFIVQAPAGSGKTELLIQRILALLANVQRPEEILAITFTRKAAAEMHGRLLAALEGARGPRPDSAHAQKTWELATAALARDAAQGWRLNDNPARLQIRTIDGFNSWLLRRMPWVTRCGGMPELVENPDPLYRLAAERTLARIESGRGADAVALLAAHVDNRLNRLRDLLVDMLRRRDQWLRHLGSEPDRRERFEATLTVLLEDDLRRVDEAFPVACRDELVALAGYAAAHLESFADHPLRDINTFPAAVVAKITVWQALASLLLTGSGTLRKTVNKGVGFPTGAGQAQEMKGRMLALLNTLADCPELIRHLDQIRQLPVTAAYPDNQWETLQALLELLPLAVAELWLVFREHGTVDFSEIALRAADALESDSTPTDLLLKLDATVEHILVDEFQDTSFLQYRLLELLTSGWQRGDGRTLFLVGDPMQSIYRFREAEVGLFLRSWEQGAGTVSLQPLRLTANFRSDGKLVAWFNQTFPSILPSRNDQLRGAVPYSAAAAMRDSGVAVEFNLFAEGDDDVEGRTIAALVKDTLREHPHDDIAVLVRSRSHLRRIFPALRAAGLLCQAHDIDPLEERPVARDLRALLRIIVQPADRLSALTVLRAPWCGLTLTDLDILCADDKQAALRELTTDLVRMSRLSVDGYQRLSRVMTIIEEGSAQRGRVGLRRLVESCWLRLGGPACYTQTDLNDAEQILRLIDRCEQGGDLLSLAEFDERLTGLFAGVDTAADARLHIMTIHKAKGLEFSTVIIPGCGRRAAADQKPLLRWLEHPQQGLLLAPFAAHDAQTEDPIFRMIGRLEKDKQDFETGRLLYVAATRARQRLIFTGSVRATGDGTPCADNGSFLEKLLPHIPASVLSRTADIGLATAEGTLSQPLRRLPLTWQPPSLVAAHFPPHAGAQTASARVAEEDSQTAIVRDFKVETGRLAGTLVHRYLERMAKTREDLRHGVEHDILARQLANLGVPRQFLAAQTDVVATALATCLSSARGRWILADHPSARCEWALSGIIAGELVHAVIDRSFVADGVRWIIDYKVTALQNSSRDAFLAAELVKYRDQLSRYAELMRSFCPDLPVRTALYFPLCDGWIELD
ncbi:MAG: UvrD-helicase domain-containing protein [Desulfuromonadales bacterium]|nr:UvrD-helicase domain-containing protein [Desulfuromonadales bacterium]